MWPKLQTELTQNFRHTSKIATSMIQSSISKYSTAIPRRPDFSKRPVEDQEK